jgi:hypothetical protein
VFEASDLGYEHFMKPRAPLSVASKIKKSSDRQASINNVGADPVAPTAFTYQNVVDHYVNGGDVSNTYSQRYLLND